MKRFFNKIFQELLFLLGFGGEVRKETVDADICDFSGQGRNKYGK